MAIMDTQMTLSLVLRESMIIRFEENCHAANIPSTYPWQSIMNMHIKVTNGNVYKIDERMNSRGQRTYLYNN